MVILIPKKRSKFRIKTIILIGENFWSKFSVEIFGRIFGENSQFSKPSFSYEKC